ncbi:MAG: VWA domain-containing protein [Verrucomicrobia bacterium]|nr:VWA domain-containing protein [Verrucomicrobiota bacterium]
MCESQSGWSFNWQTGIISVDGGRLAGESADFNRGLVLHESAHAAITRLHSIVPAETLRNPLLFALLNTIEDVRLETWMQLRFPGCQPWVREYNDRLFQPFRTTVHGPPAAQFIGALLARWWFGAVPETVETDVRLAIEEVWPAVERVLQALPPAPDALDFIADAYLRSPVSRCYTVSDVLDPPAPLEQAMRLAQYQMWSLVHQHILPVYLRLLQPGDAQSQPFLAWRSLLVETLRQRGATDQPTAATRTSRRLGGGPDAPWEPGTLDPYLASWQQQYAAIEAIAGLLLQWFHAHHRLRWQRRCCSGPRLDVRLAMQSEADPRLHDQLWIRPMLPHQIDPHFSLVIDRSGSMRGRKIEQTFHATVLLTEVCQRVGVRLDLYAFAHETECLLQHHEPLTPRVRARLAALPAAVGGETNLSDALAQVADRAASLPFADRFVWVLTDGEPNDAESARQQVARMEADGIHVVGLGLGSWTHGVRDLFPVSVVNVDAAQLPGALGSLLVRSLTGPAVTPWRAYSSNVMS